MKKRQQKVRIHSRRLNGDRGPKYAPFGLRRVIYERDAGQCQYCGVEVAMADCNIDHVYPYGHGGPTWKINLVVACSGCNELKSTQIIPEGFGPLDAGRHKRRHQASHRMKETISIIREASAMGIYLDDLFTEATQERWR